MLLAILIGMAICVLFGLPLLPVLAVGALVTCAVAYFLTKNKSLAAVGAAYAIVMANYLVMTALPTKLPQSSPLPDFIVKWARSPTPTELFAVILIIYSVFVGVFKPMDNPTRGVGGEKGILTDADQHDRNVND